MKKLIVLTVSMLILGMGISPAVNAQVEEVGIRVDGLSCPFCAYGLEKKLKKIDGVNDVIINIDKGVATLKGKKGESIVVEGLKDAVADAGFTPRQITAIVVGAVEEHGDFAVLKNIGSDFMFILKENEQLLELRSKLQDTEKQVRVEGVLTYVAPEGHDNHPYTLTIERFEVIS